MYMSLYTAEVRVLATTCFAKYVTSQSYRSGELERKPIIEEPTDYLTKPEVCM